MELEEFHDFVKDSKVETRMINFTTMTTIFAKANATNTEEAFKQRQAERRNSIVQAEMDQTKKDNDQHRPLSPKKGAFPDFAPDRLTGESHDKATAKKTKPDNRLTLQEFLGCLVRIL